MKINFNDEHIKEAVMMLINNKHHGVGTRRLMNFIEVAQSATNIHDVLSLSCLKIESLGNKEFKINLFEEGNLKFHMSENNIDIISL